MTYNEEELAKLIAGRFDGVTVSVQRERRIWLDSPREVFIGLLTWLHDELAFNQLCTVTGLDAGEEFQLVYHVAHDNGIVINVRVSAPKSNPVFDTATDIFKGGVLYELEIKNLLGVVIHGIPDDLRYPLPDNWPEGQHPLRKDWIAPGSGEASEAEGGVNDV